MPIISDMPDGADTEAGNNLKSSSMLSQQKFGYVPKALTTIKNKPFYYIINHLIINSRRTKCLKYVGLIQNTTEPNL